jgi:zinc protease
VGSGLDELTVSVQSLRKNLDQTLALVEERLLRPKFTPAAFERIKKQTLEGFKTRKSQPAAVASEVYDRINYGPENILGVSEVGTEQTVKTFTLKDVEDYYGRFLTRRGARLAVVGDISKKELLSKLEFLSKLPDREIKFHAIPSAPKVEKSRIYLVDVPKAAQTEFRVGYVTGLKYDATGDYYRAGLANYALGGMFSSRLNLNLREDKAWTYGARSGFAGDKYSGTFTFSSGIRSDATAGALAEVLKELGNYAGTGPADEELEFTRSAIGQADALRYETPLQKAGFIMRILEYNLPADYVEQQNRILAKIDKQMISPVAAKWFQTNAVNIVLVGDKAKIQDSLKKTGFDIIELDSNGDRVSGKDAAGGN